MSRVAALADLIGDSWVMQKLRDRVEAIAPLELPVLIQGPTGSGKELVARALHAASGRRGRLVPVNVCAIAETMLEDALFGHVRGAFSGAISDARGYLAEANEGTLFLDEISGLSPAGQAKLLRAVELHEYRPVGAREDRKSVFRVVAATNERLDELVRSGRFRGDLAQRITGVSVDVPSLALRLDDIPALAHAFVGRIRPTISLDQAFTDGALHLLQTRAWAGNVRELRHVVEAAFALAGRFPVTRGDIEQFLRSEDVTRTLALPNEQFASRLVLDVLASTGWDTRAAAQALGIHRSTLYRRMQRYGISVPEPANGRSHPYVASPMRPDMPNELQA